MRHRWAGHGHSARLALPALVLLLSVGGWVIIGETIRRDRDSAAERSAQITSVRVQDVLGRVRAAVVALANILADEPNADQQRFVRLASSSAGIAGLVDSMWVQRVAGGRLVATFASRTRPELGPGTDVSGWPELADALNGAPLPAVTATGAASLGGDSGFYLLVAASFGRGPDGQGVLVVFVPRGLLTVGLGQDPQRLAISLNGQLLEGTLDSPAAATVRFQALAQSWHVAVGADPASDLQSLLPWLALTWPAAAALIVFLLSRGILRRRRAEREAQRIFNVSADLLCIAGFDGYLRRVNPAWTRTTGYSVQELMSRPYLDFVHPEDLEATAHAVAGLAQGEQLVAFENRLVCADGSVRWVQWNTQGLPQEGLLYGAGRDVTDRRRAEDALRKAQTMLEASRDELRLLADEQAALRRVATLVASGAPPAEIFGVVAKEAGGVLGADHAGMVRLDPGGQVTIVAMTGAATDDASVGRRHRVEDMAATGAALRSGRSARVDDHTDIPGPSGEFMRERDLRSEVSAPIVVDGRTWGGLTIASGSEWRLPDIESRLTAFTELIATAISNAESQAELVASRARIVAAADETRRRIERDLHDGIQQRLIALALELRAAAADAPPELKELQAALARTASGLAGATDELRTISRGIHPAILSRGGLGPALRTLARRAGVPVELDLGTIPPLAEQVEVAAYYVVSEALTNAAKHARASVVHVDLNTEDGLVEVAIRDDGVGGADASRGSGLIGLRDRVETLGGKIDITSTPGQGTVLRARMPVNGMDSSSWG